MAPPSPAGSSDSPSRRVLPIVWVVLPVAAGLATLALAQAAAGVGVSIGAFSPLGPSFHHWRQGEEKDGARADAVHRAALASEPLNSLPLHMLAMHDAARGGRAAARRRMAVAERITRRDPAVQLWLADDALRADDIARALQHYDILLRTRNDLRKPLSYKLASALPLDTVRSALLPYAVPGNPWFADVLTMAARQGQAGPAAVLLLRLPVLPDDGAWRTAYGALVSALVAEEHLDILHALYGRLPGGEGAARLSDPVLGADGYAPFRWTLSNEADRFAAITSEDTGSSLQVDVAPLTSGPVAARFLLPPPGTPVLAWSIDQRMESVGGDARWSILCSSGQETYSDRLTAESGTLTVPRPCTAAQVRLLVNGGAGTDRLSLRIRHLRWLLPRRSPSSPRLRETFGNAS